MYNFIFCGIFNFVSVALKLLIALVKLYNMKMNLLLLLLLLLIVIIMNDVLVCTHMLC